MALHIESPKVEALAREVASRTGESLPEAIYRALLERVTRLRPTHAPEAETLAILKEISRRCSELPDVDSRSADEILGYAADGTFR